MSRSEQYDAVVVGASLAGCTCATLLGREGLRVALVDKHAGPEAYKRLCGHYIQASATPVIDRLGLSERIEAVGGVRNGLDMWTRWGVVGPSAPAAELPYGYSLRRQKLDPLIREIAAATPGVSYQPGQKLTALTGGKGDAARGVEVEDREGHVRRLSAPLIVGADGRNSAVASLAGAKERRAVNARFCYASYFSGVGLPDPDLSRMWMREPDVAVAARQDDGLTLLAVFGGKKQRLAAFTADREKALWGVLGELPGLDLSQARLEDEVIGYKDYALVSRSPTPGGNIALAGDAALCSDPTMGVGCGWAFESASWLADAVIPPLKEGEDLAPALRSYKRKHRKRLAEPLP